LKNLKSAPGNTPTIWIPKINLPEVLLQTGEEDEDILFKSKARIYRWKEGEWKERGTGITKILRHKSTMKIRMLMRQDKTFKIIANFLIQEDPVCQLKEHMTSDKAFFLLANDYSDEKQSIEKFVIKFQSNEIALKFKQSVLSAKDFISAVKTGKDPLYAPVYDEKPEEFINLELRKDTSSLSFSSSLEKPTEKQV